MGRKLIWAFALGLAGSTAYTGVAMATPPSGVTNPPWSPVIGTFQSGIDAKAQTDVDPGAAKDFWKIRISAKGATDVHIIENIIAPGGTFGWHSHPGPSLVIVKSGTLSVYHAPDCSSRRTSVLGRRSDRPSSTRAMTCTWYATTQQASTTSTWSRSSRPASSGASTKTIPTPASAQTRHRAAPKYHQRPAQSLPLVVPRLVVPIPRNRP